MTAAPYKWRPITDLSPSEAAFKPEQLSHLADIWRERSETLRDSLAIKRFNERLQRQWAIETGIIEGLYSIDRGVTETLIERGLQASLIPHGTTDKPASEVVRLLEDHRDALEGLFDFVAQRRTLSTSYIKELHHQLTCHQETTEARTADGRLMQIPLLHGEWKRSSNNPTRPDKKVHEYAPPEHVASEMETLVRLHQEHIENNVSPVVSASWLHHRFTQVHPFQDGNGRVARALASLVLLRAKWFPLVIHRDIREAYISALEAADFDDLMPLVDLVAQSQQDSIIRALSLAEEALREVEPLQQVIATASDKIRTRKFQEFQAMSRTAFALSKRLEQTTEARLVDAQAILRNELKTHDTRYGATVAASNNDNDFWYRRQIVSIARELHYFADTRTYRSWLRLSIHEERETDLIFSFHGLGTAFLGVMAVSAFLQHRERADRTQEGPYTASDKVFTFSYRDNFADLLPRYDAWLTHALVVGLDMWRKQL